MMKGLTFIFLLMVSSLGYSQLSQIDLPVTFEDTATVDYTLTDFGGNYSMLTVDPAGGTNLVAQSIKSISAELWAGTTMGTATGFATPIPFDANATQMSVRVYAPSAGIPIRLKVEDATDATISVETEAMTTVANAWDTLVFDFSNPVAGTATLNLANTYDKASIFFYFGTTGMNAGADTTYYWDDVMFVPGGGSGLDQIDLPVTFEDTATVDYTLTDFGGNYSMLTVDPAGGTNLVAQSIKSISAELWAGTTMGTGFATPIPFDANATQMSVRVYAPSAGIPIRLKVEDATDATISVETEAMTTVANAWDTLVFDFSNPVAGTAALNLANTYDKASIFFYFGTTGMDAGADTTYYWDDVMFVPGGGSGLDQIDLPVTFEDTATVDYTLTDFGGNYSMLTVDPAGGTNLVAQSIKSISAELWAGTTMGTATGFATPIPFDANATQMSVRVYAPSAGIPIRLKVEDATDATISVETEAMTTLANAWDTLVFDFSNPVAGTAALNLANTYDKASIFFYFGTTGMDAGADTTYYWDDVMFVSDGGSNLAQIDLPVTFEDTATVDHTLTDFGGNYSEIASDPAGGTSIVGRTVKSISAETWAGTTMGTAAGFASPIPFTTSETRMSVSVYAPAVGIPVRLKVEDATDATISVETEAMTTVANAWDTLVFDFSNHVAGTAALNLANTYDKASIFFHFGTSGADAGADTTYYWDDVIFGVSSVGIEKLLDLGLRYYPNPVQDILVLRADYPIKEFSLHNQMGQLLRKVKANSNEETIDMSLLASGIYFVKISIGEVEGTFKVLKY